MNLKLLKNTVFENIDKSNGLFKKHFHDTYTIGITHDGLFKSINSNATCLSYKNSVRIINPHEVHHGDSKDWKYTNFYPSIQLVSSVYEDMFFEKKIVIFHRHIIDEKYLYKLLYMLFNSIYNNGDDLLIQTNTINALSYLINNYTSNIKNYDNYFDDKKVILNSIEYINDSLSSNISLEDIAKQSSLSQYHFLRIFKKNIGLTPHQYILTQRINKAKNMIISGQSLINASNNVGFFDQSHFIKNFRNMYGYSPKLLLKKEKFVKFK